jgi:DNA-binding response OmpR family regulator
MQDGKYVILCIDDDDDIRESLRMILEPAGYKVVLAPTAEDGVKIFKAEKPDLVIVDLMMEEIDAGTNFVREIKLLGSNVPIYMLSSMGDTLSTATDYSALGLTGVLQKPIRPDMLLKLLKGKLS